MPFWQIFWTQQEKLWWNKMSAWPSVMIWYKRNWFSRRLRMTKREVWRETHPRRKRHPSSRRSSPWNSQSCPSSSLWRFCSSAMHRLQHCPWARLKTALWNRILSPRCWVTWGKKPAWMTQTWLLRAKLEARGSLSLPIPAYWEHCTMDCPCTRRELTATKPSSTGAPTRTWTSPSWGGTQWGAWWDGCTGHAGMSRAVCCAKQHSTTVDQRHISFLLHTEL